MYSATAASPGAYQRAVLATGLPASFQFPGFASFNRFDRLRYSLIQ